MSENYLTQPELEEKGLTTQLLKIEEEVGRRYTLLPDELEKEDRVRLTQPQTVRFPPVFSLTVFLECYDGLVRGMIANKFRVSDPDNQDDCYQEVCTRLIETRHLLCYRPLIVRHMNAPEPIRKESEREEAFKKRHDRWMEKVAPYAGKFKVSYPSFQTHIYTVTQTCCVNRGLRLGRDPSASAISLALQYGDEERSTLLERLFDPKAKNHEDLVIYGELLNSFEVYLVKKYCTRTQPNGSVVDHWGPDLPMLKVKTHTTETPAVSFQNRVPMVDGPNGELMPKLEGIHSKELIPQAFHDNVPMVYGDKGRLVPKVIGMPVMDEKGEPVYEETGEIVRRSLAQVFRFLRMGFKQSEIAKILKVTAGSPGNWVSRIRQDWLEFLELRQLPGEIGAVLV